MKEETKKSLIIIGVIITIFIVIILSIFLYQWKIQQDLENEKHSHDFYDIDWNLTTKADGIEHIIRGYSYNATLHLDVAVQYLQLNFTIAGKEIDLAYENFTILNNLTDNFSKWYNKISGIAFAQNQSIFTNGTLQILSNYYDNILRIRNSCELKHQDTRRLYLGMLEAGGIEP
jgi:hypothetical protein